MFVSKHSMVAPIELWFVLVLHVSADAHSISFWAEMLGSTSEVGYVPYAAVVVKGQPESRY